MTTVPTFYDSARETWIKCDEHRSISNDAEVACMIPKASGGTELVIAAARHFDNNRSALRGILVGLFGDGELVDFPSGERLLVPKNAILNGNPV